MAEQDENQIRAAALMDGHAAARLIAEKFEQAAHGRGGEERRRLLAHAIGARAVAVKLIELADETERR